MADQPFTGVFQIAVVVHDLDAAVRVYADKYGIGPWAFWDVDPSTVTDAVGSSEPVHCRIAIARFGTTELELIEPLDGTSRHAVWLRENGEGIEHVGFAFDDFDAARSSFLAKGLSVTDGGTWEGSRYEFFSTRADLKFDVELVEWPPTRPYPRPSSVYPEGAHLTWAEGTEEA